MTNQKLSQSYQLKSKKKKVNTRELEVAPSGNWVGKQHQKLLIHHHRPQSWNTSPNEPLFPSVSLSGHGDEKSKYTWDTSPSISPHWPGTMQCGLNSNPSSHLAWNADSLAFGVQCWVIRLLFSIASSLWPWLYAPMSCQLLRKGREEKSLAPRVLERSQKQAPPYSQWQGDLAASQKFHLLLVQPNGIFLQGKYVVGKDNNLVIPSLMELDQKLAGSELVGIHGVQQDALFSFNCHILPVELRRHWAPNLRQ